MDLLVYVPSDEPAAAELIQAMTSALGDAVGAARLPPWPPAATAAAPLVAAAQLYAFLRITRVLRAVGALDGLLATPLLLQLAGHLAAQLLPYLAAACNASLATGVALLEAVAVALPRAWLPAGGTPPPELAALLQQAGKAAAHLEAANRSGGRCSWQLPGLARRLAAALGAVGMTADAQRLAAAFGLVVNL